jgi:hypothetical protein
VHYNEATQRKINMNEVNFDILVNRIEETQHVLQNNARLVINRHVTAKAWLVGCYIVEYEQKGEDRAKYGDKLINRLAEKLDFKGFNPRRLREYRQFYLVYQSLSFEIGKYISNNHIGASLSGEKSIWRSTSAKLQLTDNQVNEIWRTPSAKLENWSTPAAWLFNKLNYTSLAYLTSIKKRITRNTRGIYRSFVPIELAQKRRNIENSCK